MSNYKSFENRLLNAISALTSGVLTSLIYDGISSTSYLLEMEGKQYNITSAGVSFWAAAGFVLATFLGIWAIISIIIPFALKVRRRFAYDKVRGTNAIELMKTLDVAKERVTTLYPILLSESQNMINSRLVNLYCRDLAEIITLLHNKFVPRNQKLKKSMLHFFRSPKYSSVITINKSVSGYEFASIISLLQEMVITVKEHGCRDELLLKDCDDLVKNLSELEDLANRVAQEL